MGGGRTLLLAIVVGACHAPLVDLHREHALTPAAVAVCVEVAVKALAAGVDAGLATRLAYRESRLRRGVVSSAGAVGPMQAIPRYWCRADPCDHVAAGVRALRYYLRREGGDVRRALCAYTGRRACAPDAVAWVQP